MQMTDSAGQIQLLVEVQKPVHISMRTMLSASLKEQSILNNKFPSGKMLQVKL